MCVNERYFQDILSSILACEISDFLHPIETSTLSFSTLSLLLLDSHTFWAKNESYCNVMIRIEQNLSSHHGFFLFFALKLILKLFWEIFLGVKVDPCRHVFLHHFLNNKIEKKKVEWTVSRHRRCLERKLCFNTSFFHLPILFFLLLCSCYRC